MSIQLNHVSYTYQKGTPYEYNAIEDISLILKRKVLRNYRTNR